LGIRGRGSGPIPRGLLLLHAAAIFQRQSYYAFEIVVWDTGLMIRVQKLDQRGPTIIGTVLLLRSLAQWVCFQRRIEGPS